MIRRIILVLIAGALGGLSSGVLVWGLGALGITPALGFNMVPDFSAGWISRRMAASAVWGVIFLLPVYQTVPLLRGAILGILPWLSSILFIFPYRMDVGFFGLQMGYGTPLWTLFFGCFWGVTGALFLARFADKETR